MSDLILREFNGKTIRHREDGYLSLTDMATANNKLFGDWNRLKTTQEYLEALQRKHYADSHNGQFIDSKVGGTPETTGTWGHRKVAIYFAIWLNADFAVQVVDWIEEYLTKGIMVNQKSFTVEEYAKIQQVVTERDNRIQKLEDNRRAMFSPIGGYTLSQWWNLLMVHDVVYTIDNDYSATYYGKFLDELKTIDTKHPELIYTQYPGRHNNCFHESLVLKTDVWLMLTQRVGLTRKLNSEFYSLFE